MCPVLRISFVFMLIYLTRSCPLFVTIVVPNTGYDSLLGGSRSELEKSGTYNLKKRDMEIGSEELSVFRVIMLDF